MLFIAKLSPAPASADAVLSINFESLSDGRPSNDLTTDYRPHIIALFSIALYNLTGMFHRTDFTYSHSQK